MKKIITLSLSLILAFQLSVSTIIFASETNTDIDVQTISDPNTQPELDSQTATIQENVAEQPQTIEEKAQSISDQLVTAYGANSVQYTLIDSGEIAISSNSGLHDIKENIPVTKDSLFGIGSVSKIYTTAAVMNLVDKNLIDIDKPITDYIPEFKMADERYVYITPRTLLNHSSGLYGTHYKNSFSFESVNRDSYDNFLENIQNENLKYTPGEFSEYCNDGFTLLEILIERVSSVSFTDFLTSTFFEPLGISDTKTLASEFDRNRLARVYSLKYQTNLPVDVISYFGTGGIYSTTEDMCKFAEVLMGNKPELLSNESVLAMQSEEYKKGIWVDDEGENIVGFGLGWDTVSLYPFNKLGITVLAKGGDSLNYHSTLVAVPEYDIAMAVSTAGGSSSINEAFAANIIEDLLIEKGVLEEKTPVKTFTAPAQVDMPEEYENYSGLYANAAQVYITVKDSMMNVKALNTTQEVPDQNYIYTGDGIFKSETGETELKFIDAPSGRTFLQVKMYAQIPNVGQLYHTSFNCQKLNDAGENINISDSWNRRLGNTYYVVDEMASSQLYSTQGMINSLKLYDDFSNGYIFGGSKIVSDNFALNTLMFRDVTDFEFFTDNENQVEYLRASSFVLIGEDNIPYIYDGDYSVCTIQDNGYTRYYKIGEGSAGKTASVNIPEGAAFAVYDANGVCIDFTTISKNNICTLPEDGIIAFIGSVGNVFEIVME